MINHPLGEKVRGLEEEELNNQLIILEKKFDQSSFPRKSSRVREFEKLRRSIILLERKFVSSRV